MCYHGILHHHHFSGKVYRHSILALLFTAAKSCNPLFWKHTQAPPISIRLEKVVEINELEDLVATERGLHKKLLKKWYTFVYLEEYTALLS